MKSGTIAALTVFGMIALGGIWYVSTGNTLITLDEEVNTSWSQVQSVYQRRADLIPNLVNTVKGYAKHESQLLESIAQARASVGQITVKSPDDLKKFEGAQTQLSSALSRLLAVSERYPELKADKNFLELQSQLEGTENRITIERQRFNETAKKYNIAVRSFPSSIVAGNKGFKERNYFEAKAGSENAPEVKF